MAHGLAHVLAFEDTLCGNVSDAPLFRVRGCSDVPWVPIVADTVDPLHTSSREVMLNIGANKGYAFVDFLHEWLQTCRQRDPASLACSANSTRPHTSHRSWVDEIYRYSKSVVQPSGKRGSGHLNWIKCGACGDCSAKHVRRSTAPLSWVPRTSGYVHAFELTAPNRALLRHLVNYSGLGERVRVWDLAGSNESRTVGIEHGGYIGAESGETDLHPAAKRDGPTTQTISVDDWMAREGVEELAQLTSDTEGHDPLVLEGARS
jgi:hypothetical protein